MRANQLIQLQNLGDEALLKKVDQLLNDDHALEVELLMYIGEVDARKLYLERAHSSMHQFAVSELHLSDAVTYKRIAVARAVRKCPLLLEKIANREIHLTAASQLAPYVDDPKIEQLIAEATHKSKREIEVILASHFPKDDAPSRVRKLPTPRAKVSGQEGNPLFNVKSASPERLASAPQPSGIHSAQASHTAAILQPPVKRDRVEPLSAQRFKVQFTADEALKRKMEEAQELLGPSVNRNDLGELFSRALDTLVRDLKNKKHGITDRPRKKSTRKSNSKTRSRTVPRPIRREVFVRDQGQCTYVDSRGHRCQERSGLEYHHENPYARGGEHSATNITLRCAGHNLHAAQQDFGKEKIARSIAGKVREAGVVYRADVGSSLSSYWIRGKWESVQREPTRRDNSPPISTSATD